MNRSSILRGATYDRLLVMNRKQAWTHYFETGDRAPLIKAYWDSIDYIAWARFPKQREDMFQWGMIGLLKAIDKIDIERVKSVDAWVYLNVRGSMLNARQFKTTVSLDDEENFIHPAVFDEYDEGLLDSLPKREALIVRLIHLENYKRTEVAKMFNLSSMRIGQLEKRALEKLRTGGEMVNALV